ncbi:DNA recombination protein RmuC [Tepidimonas charontis]|uniref:RmuC family protein n=1 Tax=Tepidimonas charontis TaxID=2267262 RepID=A0A554XF94_9BURK|nr:DNA recombination protein RmuC [Tepidimonas charontis]TSE34498.1 RmuC family protein [Tepidimonas charontis]
MSEHLVVWLVVLATVQLLIVAWLAVRALRPAPPVEAPEAVEARQRLWAWLQAQSDRIERLESELRRELSDSARGQRQEVSQTLTAFQEALVRQSAEAARTHNAQLDALVQQLAQLRASVTEALLQQLQGLTESNARRLSEVRATLEAQLQQLRESNAAKLDEMRATVDEKLHQTLEARLAHSFAQVAQRLELVHRGLGEMQSLAASVGDLKHLLTNVKTRGTFGEVQLATLLEQALAPEQYALQQPTRPGSRQVVDAAIRLPGPQRDGPPVWLPIDAKFPTEDYERLLAAQQRADPDAVEQAARALEARVRQQARSIADKYLEPPHTTEFALLFLPSEGLYAEVLRRPGLVEALQREHRVTVAGPTTLLALLNALHMGFRTLALERRSAEVWEVLGAVKTEFAKFGDVLAKVRNQTQTVLNTLDQAEVRTRQMQRALKRVEAAPAPESVGLSWDPFDDR